MALTPEQQKSRAVALGGSDCAAALGMSRFKTARQLYYEKRGELQNDREESDEMSFGQFIEPYVRQKYANETGRVIHQPKGTLVHPELAFMVAHVDGFSSDDNGEVRGYEGKSAIRPHGWGEEGTDQIPTDALLQVQHYMIVTRWRVFDVMALIGRRFSRHVVHADAELQDRIIEAEADFMRRVAEGDPPELDYTHATTLDVLKRIYPGTNGNRVDATVEALHWRQEMIKAAALESTAKKAKDEYRAHLLEETGENAMLIFPDGKCFRRQEITRKGYVVKDSTYIDSRIINTPRT